MRQRGLLGKYGINVELSCAHFHELFLPKGMRFECHEGIVYLIDKHNEIIYDMDYRMQAYDRKSPRDLAPYPYKDELERRANQIWIEQGRPTGRSLEHWVQAKHEWNEKHVESSAQMD